MLSSFQIDQALQRAQSLAQAGRMSEAWAAIQPLRSAIDRHGGALRLYAFIAHNNGQSAAAIDALKRICAIEGNPPDMVGALADTLGGAGRHAEAYERWSQLVAKQPDAIDAHLNRSISAVRGGRFEEAIAAAEAGLARKPGHLPLLEALASALRHAGRHDDAIQVYSQATSLAPDQPGPAFNLGVALRSTSRHEEAVACYAQAERNGMNSAALYSAWAAAELERGYVDRSKSLYARALAQEPGHAETLKALTRIEFEYDGSADPFRPYRDSVQNRGGTFDSWMDWINATVANDRHGEGAIVAAEALKQHPGDFRLESIREFLLGMTGNAAEHLANLDRIGGRYPKNPSIESMGNLLAIRAGDPARAAAALEREVAGNPGNQVAWAQLSVVWRLLGDPREEWLCDYGRLVMPIDVPSVDGVDAKTFAAEVAVALRNAHSTRFAPGDQTLRGGTQTSGNLFERPDPTIQKFRQSVLAAAREALAALPTDDGHPFLRRKVGALSFSGSWSVLLRGGGHHVPHYHSEGWMSSAYYAELPDSIEDEKRHEGWIQFGVPPMVYGLDLEPRRVVKPHPGRLVLFPSYLWHGTIPFGEGHGERLTAAFDYQSSIPPVR